MADKREKSSSSALIAEVDLWRKIDKNRDLPEGFEHGRDRIVEILTKQDAPGEIKAMTAIIVRVAEWDNKYLYDKKNVSELEKLDQVKRYLFQHIFDEPNKREFFDLVYGFLTKIDEEKWRSDIKPTIYEKGLPKIWELVDHHGLWDHGPSGFNAGVMELAKADRPPSSYFPGFLKIKQGG